MDSINHVSTNFDWSFLFNLSFDNSIYLIIDCISSTFGCHLIQCHIISILGLGKFKSKIFLIHTNLFRTWFYFAVKGIERGKTVHFHIKNLNFQRSLYAAGLKPFFRVGKEGKFKRILGKLTWNVSYFFIFK